MSFAAFEKEEEESSPAWADGLNESLGGYSGGIVYRSTTVAMLKADLKWREWTASFRRKEQLSLG